MSEVKSHTTFQLNNNTSANTYIHADDDQPRKITVTGGPALANNDTLEDESKVFTVGVHLSASTPTTVTVEEVAPEKPQGEEQPKKASKDALKAGKDELPKPLAG